MVFGHFQHPNTERKGSQIQLNEASVKDLLDIHVLHLLYQCIINTKMLFQNIFHLLNTETLTFEACVGSYSTCFVRIVDMTIVLMLIYYMLQSVPWTFTHPAQRSLSLDR